MDRYYKENDIKEYLEGKAEHYKKRIKRIKGYGKKISYNPKEQIDGWRDEVAIYESMIRELAENVSTIETSEDCISRKWVKKNMLKYGFLAPDMTVTEFIADAPSVVPVCEECGNCEFRDEDFDDALQSVAYEHGYEDGVNHATTAQSPMAGEWKWESQDICDNCGYEIPHLERVIGEIVLMDSRDWGFCPNCGNRRKGTNNE